MTFWALGAFDKVKGMADKLQISEYGTALKNMMNTQPSQQVDESPQKQQPIPPRLTQQDRMKIQLQEYKTLVSLQEDILKQHEDRQRTLLTQRQSQLVEEQRRVMAEQKRVKQSVQRAKLQNHLQQGKVSPQQVIEENIMLREKVLRQQQLRQSAQIFL